MTLGRNSKFIARVRNVRIVVVGDGSVGKSMIIQCFVSKSFSTASSRVPTLMDQVIVPGDKSFEKDIPLIIYDTSSHPLGVHKANHLMSRQADVIVLACDVTQNDSTRRAVEEWIPRFQKLQIKCPIILALNKCNPISDKDELDGDQYIQALTEHPMIERSVRCSATRNWQIRDVFHAAFYAVQYPVGLLRNNWDGVPREKFVRALKRIFRMCDNDNDLMLNNFEIEAFQMNAFGSRLSDRDIDYLKKRVQEEDMKSLDLDTDNLTFCGFQQMFLNFLKIHKTDMCWDALHNYGYTFEIDLDREQSVQDVPPGTADQLCVLSKRAITFLADVFLRFDSNHDGFWTVEDMENCFAASPSIPFDKDVSAQVETNEDGELTLNGWVCLWTMLAARDPEALLFHLAHLGYEKDWPAVLSRCKAKSREREQIFIDREVLQCFVIGSRLCGKSSLIHRLVQEEWDTIFESNSGVDRACNTVIVQSEEAQEVATKYLIMNEVPAIIPDEKSISFHGEDLEQSNELELNMKTDEKIANKADIVVLAYDRNDSGSLEYIVDIMEQKIYPAIFDIPIVVVQLKNDLEQVIQLNSEKSDEYFEIKGFCDKWGLSVPEKKLPDTPTEATKVYEHICEAPSYAEEFRPESDAKKFRRRLKYFGTCVKRGITLSVIVGFAAYGFIHAREKYSSNQKGDHKKSNL
eukprot:184662_1